MNLYVIAYDITDDGRRTDVFEYLRRWGNHLQYSVFRCELGKTALADLHAELDEIINHDEDQILFFDLGPVDGRAAESVISMGQPYTHPERHAFVF